jgi:transposase-like protein
MGHGEAEKMEIIRMVEESEFSVLQMLQELDVNRSSFYEWYARYRAEGYDGLSTRKPQASRFWNRIPEEERKRALKTVLERLEDSPRQLAWHITDREGYLLSESSVYRILRDYDLLPSPACIVLKAAERFAHPLPGCKSSGRRISRTSRSSVGGGTIWRPCWTITRVISWPGSSNLAQRIDSELLFELPQFQIAVNILELGVFTSKVPHKRVRPLLADPSRDRVFRMFS